VRRDQNGPGNHLSSVLVAYASVEGHTGRIAQRIAEVLRAAGHRVDVAPADDTLDFAPYTAVIVGASVHYGHHPAWLAALLRRHSATLAGRRAAFFSVSLGAKEHYATKFLLKAGWRQPLTAVFAGALRYSKYGPVKRLVVKAFAAVGGHDTDTSRDYDYTNWKAVEDFATAFSQIAT
jgi:menaquinone-dependent protoporphyrinogen oxidase